MRLPPHLREPPPAHQALPKLGPFGLATRLRLAGEVKVIEADTVLLFGEGGRLEAHVHADDVSSAIAWCRANNGPKITWSDGCCEAKGRRAE